ncbi:MAG: hypothetical protein ABFR97_09440 [Thermodesulfobacteriota bacterium]
MIEQNQRQLIKGYLDMVLRQHKIITAFLFIGLAAGLVSYVISAKKYEATSLLKYQRQRVNPTRMSPDDVRSRTEEVVSTVTQQVTSRTSLEGIIKQYDLYEGMRAIAPMEDVVTVMRDEHITITRAGDNRRGDIYAISYQGGDPKAVMMVANALASKFIEENLRFRAEQASDTSSYIQDELAMAKKGLDEKEEVMRDYKLKHYNEMPEQQEANVSRLNALNTQYQGIQNSIHEMERTKVMVQEQISLRKDLLAQLAAMGTTGSATALSRPGEVDTSLAGLRAQLTAMQSRYTPNHPGVRRLQRQIAEVEGQMAASLTSAPGAGGDDGAAPVMADSQMQQLQQQLTQLTFEVGELKKGIPKTLLEISKYQAWVEATPIREAEWSTLTRDYEQFNAHYQDLVSRGLEAKSAYTLEKQQRGSQFKIVDPAHLPETPISPNFKKIMAMAVAGGLGLGAALAFGVEVLSSSFKDPCDVEKSLGVPVLCAIPYVPEKNEIARARLVNGIWWIFCACCCVALLGAIIFMKVQGVLVM